MKLIAACCLTAASLLSCCLSCYAGGSRPPAPEPRGVSFGREQAVQVAGYDGDLMEPFISRDGRTLYFNDSNDPSVDTDLHFAERIDDRTFRYRGRLSGANSESLDGVPTVDESGRLYFVSTRSYGRTRSTIYTGRLVGGEVIDVRLVSGVSRNTPGWVNFDVEVSKDGRLLVFVDGRFDERGGPHQADLVLATGADGAFHRKEDGRLLEKVNTGDLEYAACLSADTLELYFTRAAAPLSASSVPRIYRSTRGSTDEPFGTPRRIEAITGFAEAPTVSPDGRTIYYHKRESGGFGLYLVRREQAGRPTAPGSP